MIDTSLQRGFKGVWIPKEIWLSEDLSLIEKCLFVEIDSLDQGDDHCYAKNEHFMKFLGCSEDTISRAIKKLEKMDYVITKKKVTQSGTIRIMRVAGSAKCGSRAPQNAGLLVIQEESNTNTEEFPFARDEESEKPKKIEKAPKPKKASPVADEIKKVEDFYFATFSEISTKEKLPLSKPLYDYAKARPLIARRLKEAGIKKVCHAIDVGSRDQWILQGGFMLTTVLSATVMARLLSDTKKSKQNEEPKYEEEDWKKGIRYEPNDKTKVQ